MLTRYRYYTRIILPKMRPHTSLRVRTQCLLAVTGENPRFLGVVNDRAGEAAIITASVVFVPIAGVSLVESGNFWWNALLVSQSRLGIYSWGFEITVQTGPFFDEWADRHIIPGKRSRLPNSKNNKSLTNINAIFENLRGRIVVSAGIEKVVRKHWRNTKEEVREKQLRVIGPTAGVPDNFPRHYHHLRHVLNCA